MKKFDRKNVLRKLFITLKFLKRIFFVLVMAVVVTIAVCSCNVTRTVTTSSQYYQHGDTSVVIQTKTIEQYDASKRF